MATSQEPVIRVEHREELAYLLTEAAEIEHGLMACYLYAAFSIGKPREAGLPPERAAALARWRAEITSIARDEMTHLALVANLTNAIGATPHFLRPNFPVSPGYHPAGVTVALAPFCAATIDHFVFLERPEGAANADGAGFQAPLDYKRTAKRGRLVPTAQDYATVGHLYRGIEDGLGQLAAALGEEALFVGDRRLQLDGKTIGLPDVIPIVDLASATRALETIVAQGEGAADAHVTSHYCRFLAIRDELRAIHAVDPDFDPARGVAKNPVMRRPPQPDNLTWIDAEPAASVLDLGNAAYAFMLRGLATLYSPIALAPGARSAALAATTTGMRALVPLGELLATLPASTTQPGLTAGLTFTISRSLGAMAEPRGAFRGLAEASAGLVDGIRAIAVPLDASLERTAALLEQLSRELAALGESAPEPSYGAAAGPAPAPAAPGKLPIYTPGAPGGIEEARGEKLVLRNFGKRCIHSRHCVLMAPTVFKANTPGEWLFPDTMDVEELVRVIETCPSGALTYERLDGGPAEVPQAVNTARLRENGPYAIAAELTVVGHGAMTRATLCRCGQSKNKPFCDGAHNAAQFRATGEPETRESKPLDVRGGALEVRPLPDGPLQVSGPLEICCNTGRTVDRITGARLCRCGGSSTKPFCDGTHAKIGFKSENPVSES